MGFRTGVVRTVVRITENVFNEFGLIGADREGLKIDLTRRIGRALGQIAKKPGHRASVFMYHQRGAEFPVPPYITFDRMDGTVRMGNQWKLVGTDSGSEAILGLGQVPWVLWTFERTNPLMKGIAIFFGAECLIEGAT